MDNISQKTVELQMNIVEKFNRSNYDYLPFRGSARHGLFIDQFWAMNGVNPPTINGVGNNKKVDYDVVIILDIDCIPLHVEALDYIAQRAKEGIIVGNAQRTNHLDNGKHVFAAPSATAISRETFIKIGAPSALETSRGDVLEEYTWAAESNGVTVEKLMPIKYDAAPMRYDWEKDQPPYWALGDGMPVYGMGTTYGVDNKEYFFHNFQIRLPGQEQRFWQKCEEVLSRDTYEDRSIKH